MACIITRQELYELVWTTPLRSLAKEFDVSDVAIGKDCRKAHIPRPGVGYWAKQRAGKSMKRIALPPRFPGASDTIHIGLTPYNGISESQLLEGPLPTPPVFDEDIDDLVKRIQQIVRNVSYPSLEKKTHSIIAKFLQQDEERRQEYEKYHASWYAPKFVSVIEKRLSAYW